MCVALTLVLLLGQQLASCEALRMKKALCAGDESSRRRMYMSCDMGSRMGYCEDKGSKESNEIRSTCQDTCHVELGCKPDGGTCAGHTCSMGLVKKAGVDALLEPSDEICCELTCAGYQTCPNGRVTLHHKRGGQGQHEDVCCADVNDCSRVLGASWRESWFWQSEQCKCPRSSVITGDSQSCKEKAAKGERYFKRGSDVGKDGTCRCAYPGDLE